MIFRKKCPKCRSYQTRKKDRYDGKSWICDNCGYEWRIENRKCPNPDCGSFRIEQYDNHGEEEWICTRCGEQWQYDADGDAISL